ncbi:hypothetical protein [Amycolatopsis keratiniphila]|uniref:Uncharacterized protein n=1 Tax=Amycolatopsis keratiniphila subsp. keratiniphila TaxID=227715 RepID=A0A1W2LJ39_9PSEU|nr:hypothetical protein [Amycolatopsis keratiniphila]OLZ59883.1 hypothetical protein BS330_05900 [Amycolatopsis keratiniphila subsp. nogabecina]ONF62871.1 hypothetical protein AVR91_0236070 [Amycolatopsis keratiniphila subsp. keratiniphila]SDU56083.1 hypothetical protein SAMN04489733_6095 [Amycolatopsis keratiniphila]
MDDGYFTALDAETTSGFGDNSKLLEGISHDLTAGAEKAFTALDLLYPPFFGADVDLSGGLKEEVRDFFLEFSEAELVGETSLQTMIEAYEGLWNAFQDTKAPLDRSLVLLLKWRGEGAETAKSYIQGLVNTYSRVGTKLTVLEADIVAARDAIATARADLSTLAASFLTAAEKYRDDKERQDESALVKALAATFAAAVTALLVAAAPPAGLTAATFFTTANGVQVAGAAAGAGLSTLVSENAAIVGDSPEMIYNSFHDGVVNIREAMFRASESLISKINTEINNLPIIPEPPDVSPGETFDPGNFETENTDKGTEKRVRDKNVDISNDGKFQEPPRELSPLKE